jgi:hypothetical protein
MLRNCALVSKNGPIRAIHQTERGHFFNGASTCCCEVNAITLRKTSNGEQEERRSGIVTSIQVIISQGSKCYNRPFYAATSVCFL